MVAVLIVKLNLKMPTNLNKNNLKDLGDIPNNVKIEKVVEKADTTLSSVERIAGKVENIISMVTKFKEMGQKQSTPATSFAPKIEAGVEKGLSEKTTKIKSSAKIKINFKEIEKQLDKFLNTLDDKKTIKEIKDELKELKKLGMTEKVLSEFILNNCEVVF